MANACDDYEQPKIDYLFNAVDEIQDAVNRSLGAEALRRFETLIRERVCAEIEKHVDEQHHYDFDIVGLRELLERERVAR